MGGKKIPLHGWPMSLTAAMAKPRFRFARKAPKERCCPGPRYSAGSLSLSREDRFYTEAEQDRFDNIDPIAIREALPSAAL